MVRVFIISLLAAILMAIIGGYYDYLILEEGSKIPEWSKWFGNGIEIAVVWFVCFLFRKRIKLFELIVLFVITLIVWNISHDMILGYLLTGNIFHLGNTGFDKFMGEIFQNSGILYTFVRVFVLIIASGWYFSYSS